MQKGIRFAIDVGDVRIGVAQSDPDAILAYPVETVRRNGGDIRKISRMIMRAHKESVTGVAAVYVGLPLLMDGSEGKQARLSRMWARYLVRAIAPIPVIMWDERLTSYSAHSLLREAGVDSRHHRQMVDQVAAVVILENALDYERIHGHPRGNPLDYDSSSH